MGMTTATLACATQIKLIDPKSIKIIPYLAGAVERSLIFDSSTTGHHHSPPDGINGVGHEACSDGHTITQTEGKQETSVRSQEHGFQGVVETEVESSVHKDTNTRDDETERGCFRKFWDLVLGWRDAGCNQCNTQSFLSNRIAETSDNTYEIH